MHHRPRDRPWLRALRQPHQDAERRLGEPSGAGRGIGGAEARAHLFPARPTRDDPEAQVPGRGTGRGWPGLPRRGGGADPDEGKDGESDGPPGRRGRWESLRSVPAMQVPPSWARRRRSSMGPRSSICPGAARCRRRARRSQPGDYLSDRHHGTSTAKARRSGRGDAGPPFWEAWSMDLLAWTSWRASTRRGEDHACVSSSSLGTGSMA